MGSIAKSVVVSKDSCSSCNTSKNKENQETVGNAEESVWQIFIGFDPVVAATQ